jgi:hypothetical protein
MDIRDVVLKRDKLEAEILRLISDFEQETDTRVDNIGITYTEFRQLGDDKPQRLLTGVICRLQL